MIDQLIELASLIEDVRPYMLGRTLKIPHDDEVKVIAELIQAAYNLGWNRGERDDYTELNLIDVLNNRIK